MNLLAELTANAYQIDLRASGKRVTFAVEGEEASVRERTSVRQDTQEAA